ncbi:unnamed protein product [Musa acuminata subsp. malaccensis]|uniref:Protein EARLY HEADING DATE 2 n=1 Tax=Musa acuminata subsp. malaccensis TaxID=214687 RepID=A0A8D6ZXD7_MUSAM|nr:unnamed protein product [Musa acuminata subsp. malaccensis]
MASASRPMSFFEAREDEHRMQAMQQQQSSSVPAPSTAAPVKKRRNLPGNPCKYLIAQIMHNPNAEVIALSPRTLMATNRFVCEVCNKGFQREQNLQLHRRGHNLPWKLRQKDPKEVRRRVYLCPEPTCPHHDPSRALGDLTGIKKHFCRKHGEKKWNCDKCSKRYAVQSDWKAHSKICGTREYRCDCGTLFSRRDSFITHRAFCEALAHENGRLPSGLHTLGGSHIYGNSNMFFSLPRMSSHTTSLHGQHIISPPKPLTSGVPRSPPSSSTFHLDGSSDKGISEGTQSHQSLPQCKTSHGLMQLPELLGNTAASTSASAAAASADLFNHSFFSNNSTICRNPIADQIYDSNRINEPTACFAGNLVDEQMEGGIISRYSTLMNNEPVMLPQQLSATALLQRAAQLGATSSRGSSFLACFSGNHGSVIDGFGPQMENDTHFQYLMNSLARGGIDLVGSSAGMATFEGGCTTTGGRHGQENTGVGTFNVNNIDEPKYNLPSSDGLTRDFLGVGSTTRSMGGGISQREQHHGIAMSSGSSSQYSFAGGSLQ